MKTVVPDASKSFMKIWWLDDETKFVVKSTMQLSLSCDHRVMDGVMGANFINTVKKWVVLYLIDMKVFGKPNFTFALIK